MWRLKRLLLIVALLTPWLLSLSAPVLANAGPAVIPAPDRGGAVLPAKNEAVSVEAEHLLIDFSALPGEWQSQFERGGGVGAQVTASYQLQNHSPADEQLLLAFPYWSFGGDKSPYSVANHYRIAFDGAAVAARDVALDEGWAIYSAVDRTLRALVFEVTVPGGAESRLEVSYRQALGFDKYTRRDVNSLTLDYVLRSARYWRDFRDLEIEVLAPAGRSIESNLTFERVEGDGASRFLFRSASLPEEDLKVALHYPISTQTTVLRFLGNGSEYAGQMNLLLIGGMVLIFLLAAGAAALLGRAAAAVRGNAGRGKQG